MVSNINTPKVDVKIAEMRLTWLVYIIGSAVGGRVSFNSNDEHDAMDGELVCRYDATCHDKGITKTGNN